MSKQPRKGPPIPHWTAPIEEINAQIHEWAMGESDRPRVGDDKQRRRERKAQRAARKKNR